MIPYLGKADIGKETCSGFDQKALLTRSRTGQKANVDWLFDLHIDFTDHIARSLARI